jgi:hypothetical protein
MIIFVMLTMRGGFPFPCCTKTSTKTSTYGKVSGAERSGARDTLESAAMYYLHRQTRLSRTSADISSWLVGAGPGRPPSGSLSASNRHVGHLGKVFKLRSN